MFVVIAIALVVLAIKRAWPQFGLLAIAMAAEGGVYVTATYVISRNRPAVPRLEDLILADSYPSGHTAAAMALYGSLVHHRLVAHPVPRVARAVPRPRDRRTADRRHVTRLPRHAQRDRRDLRTAHRRRVHHGRLRRRPCRVCAARAQADGSRRSRRRSRRRRCAPSRRWPDDLDRSGRARPQEARRGPGGVAARARATPASTTRPGSRSPRASSPPTASGRRSTAVPT